jgi:rod shape-determining protein MreB
MGITTVEKRALFDAAARAGASEVYLLEEPRAAGLGAGIPIHEARAHMIVDIGGGTTDIAILSLADVVISETLAVAGEAMDDAIIEHLRRNFNILIGPNTAEHLKLRLGSACVSDEEREESVRGRDLLAGRPRAVTVTTADVREALAGPVRKIIDAVESAIQKTGPELSGDLVENGIVLCGGGALLPELDLVLEEETGLPVRVDADPLTTVARGTSVFLECLDEFKDVLESPMDAL